MKKLSLSTSFFEDNKIKAISLMKNNDTALLLYLKLLFNCCKEDGDGKLILFGDIPYDEKIISGIYSIPEKTVSECLELLTRFGFITKEDGCYVISNFDEITGKDFREIITEVSKNIWAKSFILIMIWQKTQIQQRANLPFAADTRYVIV